jgi:lysophosphatidate acyltransferase
VSTEGLTTEDVGELVIHVRDQMLSALNEISVKVPATGQRTQSHDTGSSILEVDPSPTPSSVGGREGARDAGIVKKEGSETGTETEEDEGMVMVGRP